MIKLNVQLNRKIKLKNKACSPAKGTVLNFNLLLITEKNSNEKNNEKENNTKKETVGNPTAITKKNNRSPNPKVFCKDSFNLNLAYK